MSDTIDNAIHTERLTGRKLANAFTLLLSDLADEVDARFPTDGDPKTAQYVANYEAHRSAYAAVKAATVGVPADAEFRALLLDFVQRSWNLTHGDPAQDEVVSRCIGRAADDYRPDTPDALKRTTDATRKVPTKKEPGK